MCIKITQCATFFQNKLRFTETTSFIGFQFQLVNVVDDSGFRMHIIAHQLYNLILIGRISKAGIPTKISPAMIISQHGFKTVVTYISGLHIEFVVTRGYGKFGIERLVVRIGIIERTAQLEIFEKRSVQTDFPRIGTFGVQFADREVLLRFPVHVSRIIRVGRISKETGIGITYGTERTAHFQIIHPFRHFYHLRNDGRQAD